MDGRRAPPTSAGAEELDVFEKHFGLDTFAMELAESKILQQGLLEALERKQAEFDLMIKEHPETITEKARWNENRQELIRRTASLGPYSQSKTMHLTEALAKSWGAKLVHVR